MRTNALAEALPLEAAQDFRDPKSQARFSELLRPKEAAARLTESGSDLQCVGWAVRTELTTDEIELFQTGAGACPLQLDMEQFAPGLPVAVLRAMTQGVEFRFGVPLWLSGAPDWLLDAVDRDHLLVFLDRTGGDFGVALHGSGELHVDRLSIIAAATLARCPDGDESRQQMLVAAQRLLRHDGLKSARSGPAPRAIRASLAGQGPDALAALACLRSDGAKGQAR